MKTLYALVTTMCNLSCPYCDVRDKSDNYDRDKFISQLDQFDGQIILFGGEPTLFPDRLIDIYLSNPNINKKISSISTNLIKIDSKILTLFRLIGSVSTSWNPERFSLPEYHNWLTNMGILNKALPDMKIGILVTMTDKLLNMSTEEFNLFISDWNPAGVKHIRFEHYIGEDTTEDYFHRCDEWLCNIYKSWNSPIPMFNVGQVDNWYFDCSDTWTLKPDGTLNRGCPHTSSIHVPDKCYTCERWHLDCRPCRLQKYCSYPEKFIELVKRSEGGV